MKNKKTPPPRKEVCKEEVRIAATKYDRERRMFDILGSDSRTHALPYETDWRVRISPGMHITITTYQQEGVQYKEVHRGTLLIGHYGPMEKFKRDQHYGHEVSRKAANL